MQSDRNRAQGTKASLPVSHAARPILDDCFALVRGFLDSASKNSENAVEDVRRLHAATRHALAALQVFQNVLPKKRATKLKDEFCRLQKSAGRVRDLDMLKRRLDNEKAESKDLESSALNRVYQKRKSAQKRLSKAADRWQRKQIDLTMRQLLRRIRWRPQGPEPDFATIAESQVLDSVAEFISASEDDLSQICVLYEINIRGKRLRHVLDIAKEACNSSILDGLISDLQQLQDKLGDVLEHANSKMLLTKWTEQTSCRKVRTQLTALAAIEDDRIQKSFQRFREWWTPGYVEDLRRRLNQPLGC